MTAKHRLSDSEISSMEAKIASGDFSVAKAYARDALNYHFDSIDVLKRRKEQLLKYCARDDSSVQYYAVLSALVDDRQGWDRALELLSERIHPSVGYRAFMFLSQHRNDLLRLPRWKVLLESSASMGHFQARTLAFKMKVSRWGVFSLPLVAVYMLWMNIHLFFVAIRNPSDERLPDLPNRKRS